ncbi:hypothetical protein OsI_26929 [Oryza sativa Indica Group]|uniref:SKP1 component POZ domain-containing protein n=1 Tax=Oryza sativa subsp. indica TaxID=39946 RepID=B8B4U7_ORYSI|nr:hypothetical protein OsI_26929 [Oryza sativa Indica Group]
MITLKSSDGEPVEVTEASARISKVIGDKIDAGRGGEAIPLPHVDNKTLKKVIEYCDEHANENSDTDEQKEELKNWDKAFIDELDEDDGSFLFLVLLASSYLKIDGLLDLTYQRVADNSKAKTTEEIRKAFSTIEIELSDKEEEEQQQEEEIRPENHLKNFISEMYGLTDLVDEEEDGRGDDDRDAPADRDDRARGRRRGRRGHNNDHPRANQNWRCRDRDDDDWDERGRDFGRGRGEQRAIDQDYRRERTRSPRQRDRGGHSRHGGRRHHAGATDVDNVTDPVYPEPHLAEISLPSRQQELHTEVCKFRLLHALHTSPFRTQEIPASPPTSTGDQLLCLALVADKAMAAPPPTAMEDLAIRSSTGTEAWFSGTAWKPVPVARVFGRIREALPATPAVETPTTYQQIEEALMRLELAAAAARTPGDDTLLPQPMSPAPLAASPPRRLEDLASDAGADKILPAPLPRGAASPRDDPDASHPAPVGAGAGLAAGTRILAMRHRRTVHLASVGYHCVAAALDASISAVGRPHKEGEAPAEAA